MKRLAILTVVLCAGCSHRPAHAEWNGRGFSCPAGTYIWADESAARAGKPNYAYCVKIREVEE